MKIWHDCIKPILTIVCVSVLLIGGLIFFCEREHDKEFNNGYCQICGEEVIPIGHAYTTDYYCQKCHRYND